MNDSCPIDYSFNRDGEINFQDVINLWTIYQLFVYYITCVFGRNLEDTRENKP